MKINIFESVGSFAENKDLAQEIRTKKIMPAIEEGKEVILDFKDVDSATQSFIHALISDVIRQNGVDVLDQMLFKNCNEKVKKIITIVVEYMQESSI